MPIRFAASVALLLLSFAPATRAQSAADGLPGEAARTPHFTQVVGLVWRTVALWLLLLVLLTLAHVLG